MYVSNWKRFFSVRKAKTHNLSATPASAKVTLIHHPEETVKQVAQIFICS